MFAGVYFGEVAFGELRFVPASVTASRSLPYEASDASVTASRSLPYEALPGLPGPVVSDHKRIPVLPKVATMPTLNRKRKRRDHPRRRHQRSRR